MVASVHFGSTDETNVYLFSSPICICFLCVGIFFFAYVYLFSLPIYIFLRLCVFVFHCMFLLYFTPHTWLCALTVSSHQTAPVHVTYSNVNVAALNLLFSFLLFLN